MYNRVLVPLDGSELSECSLEHMKNIVSGCHVGQTVLLRVIEPFSALTVSGLAEAGDGTLLKAEQEYQAEAKAYIENLKNRLQSEGLAVDGVVISGNTGRPAEEILDYARNNHVDLIIMTTHGKSGISQWFFGSVARKVMEHSTVPVLMISPPGCRVPPQ